MTYEDLAALTYTLGVRRCLEILSNTGHGDLAGRHIEFISTESGNTYCTISGYTQEGNRVASSVKVDAKPEPGMTGPKLNGIKDGEPDIIIIMEQIKIGNAWMTIYENPRYR